MATTTNYGWETPDDTDAVYLGAAAVRTLGAAIDTTVAALAAPAGYSLIIDTTTATGAAFTLSGLTGYRRLILEYKITSASNATVNVTINSDTAAHYTYSNWLVSAGAQAVAFGTTPATSMSLYGPGSTGQIAAGRMLIDGATSSAYKSISVDATGKGPSGSADGVFTAQFFWSGAATISTITFTLSTGTFTASNFRVWGAN